jgi:enoyl-CoA hydratase
MPSPAASRRRNNKDTHSMTASMEELVVSETRGSVLHVTINRPDSRNALSRATLDALKRAFEDAAADDSLHVAVLSAAGDKSFAAGGDLKEFAALRSEADAQMLFDRAAEALDAIRSFPVPVVAALNGIALGGGAELAMACDYRLAAVHARIGFVQSTLAISTGFGGGADLVNKIGSARAMRILVLGEVLSANAAAALGLVDGVAGPDESLDECVARFVLPFLSRPSHLVRAIKQIGLAHRLGLSQAECRTIERNGFAKTWAHPAHWEASDHMLAVSATRRNP